MLPQLPVEMLGQKPPEDSSARLLNSAMKKEVYEGKDSGRKAAIQRRLQRYGGPQQPGFGG